MKHTIARVAGNGCSSLQSIEKSKKISGHFREFAFLFQGPNVSVPTSATIKVWMHINFLDPFEQIVQQGPTKVFQENNNGRTLSRNCLSMIIESNHGAILKSYVLGTNAGNGRHGEFFDNNRCFQNDICGTDRVAHGIQFRNNWEPWQHFLQTTFMVGT